MAQDSQIVVKSLEDKPRCHRVVMRKTSQGISQGPCDNPILVEKAQLKWSDGLTTTSHSCHSHKRGDDITKYPGRRGGEHTAELVSVTLIQPEGE
jgi:hypothetical protein